MNTRTYTPRASEIERQWFVVDADGQTLGRLASRVATLLAGKHKPAYATHIDTGDHVIVINAAKVLVTGSKLDGKTYTHYSGYPSGLRTRTLRKAQELDPTFPITNAVKGMLQHNTLGADMLKRLRVYPGPEHEHAAQQPKPIKFNQAGDIDLG